MTETREPEYAKLCKPYKDAVLAGPEKDFSTAMAVSLKEISFSYDPARKVLSNISFSVAQGKLLALVGPSGCGKSTLLRIVAGLLPKKAEGHCLTGEVMLGESPTGASHFMPGEMALMFQEPVLLPNRTVERNISLLLEMLGLPESQISERVDALATQVGLNDYRHLRPSALSVGMKSRAALAMTFSTLPSYLLLDEPFSALDYGWRLALYKILGDLRALSNPTTILVTHDIREAVLLADQVIVLSADGHLVRKLSVDIERPRKYTADELAMHNRVALDLHSQLESAILSEIRET